jgi:pimeloyl-ACP methyl ester carboxylesterase
MGRDNEPRIPGDRSMTQDSTSVLEAAARVEPTQLEGFQDGARFGVWWLPTRRSPRGAVLCVQPLGAERTTARHALSTQAWRLAERGWAVLMVDLYGTGDSPGEPGQATLEGWRADLLRAAMIARQRHAGPNVLWGVRDGALLASDIAVALDQLVDAYVFWQAPESGHGISDDTGEGGALSQALLVELRGLHMQPPPASDHGTPPSALFLEFVDPAAGRLELSAHTAALTEAWLAAGYLATPRNAGAARFWVAGHETARSRQATDGASASPASFATEEFLEGLR